MQYASQPLAPSQRLRLALLGSCGNSLSPTSGRRLHAIGPPHFPCLGIFYSHENVAPAADALLLQLQAFSIATTVWPGDAIRRGISPGRIDCQRALPPHNCLGSYRKLPRVVRPEIQGKLSCSQTCPLLEPTSSDAFVTYCVATSVV